MKKLLALLLVLVMVLSLAACAAKTVPAADAPKQMNALDGALKDDADKNPDGLDMLAEGSRIDLLENKVALAVAEGNPKGIESFDQLAELLQSGDVMLAIGNSDVPVGQYTQKIFAYYGIDETAIAGNLTYGSNVKEVTTAVSAVVVFFAGIAAAYYIAKLPRLVKGVLDVFLTLPLVLPPTVVGYLLLRVLGPKRLIGAWVLETFGIRLVMTWWSAIFATVAVVFPLMYRTVRGAFEAFDETLAYAGQTLGLSNTYIFWHIRMPCCQQGVLAGAVLAFARALGEYGATSMIAGYTPGKTATVSTTVYQLWQINNDERALKWVLVNVRISAVILLIVNMLEKKNLAASGQGRRHCA